MSQLYYRRTDNSSYRDRIPLRIVRAESELSTQEKAYLGAVEKGDYASVKQALEEAEIYFKININCVDPLGRTALLIAIENENLEIIELLLSYNVYVGDALLHAIRKEVVGAVELLLNHKKPRGEKQVPPALLDRQFSDFTPDITPIILAAHTNNYEVIKIIIQKGVSIPQPHEVRCNCVECVSSSDVDSLRHSRSRLNIYRALSSPSLIAVSSEDPFLTAFQLSWELQELSKVENEFKAEYEELSRQCKKFAKDLLDQTRSSRELELILNFRDDSNMLQDDSHNDLARLKLAIKYRQKEFVAQPNCQQLLASRWYDEFPGWRRRHWAGKLLTSIFIGLLFPLFSLCYLAAPKSRYGLFIRKPFIKFICHTASYLTFLFLLLLASQRIDSSTDPNRQGPPPTTVEWMILPWVVGFIWTEIKQMWDGGLHDYIHDWWNLMDFVMNSLYLATISLKIVAYVKYSDCKSRTNWEMWHPTLVAEALFAIANIFSSLRLISLFTANSHLGPLQISLGRMLLDILKFLFIYCLVLLAFANGLNQLYFYYDTRHEGCKGVRCERQNNAFSTLFETLQSLFWSIFGLISLYVTNVQPEHVFTEFVGATMFGTYNIISLVVLLNMLIAMMNNSYQHIADHADIEWKFARTKLWMSYFEEGGTLPTPFNIIPSPKSVWYLVQWIRRNLLKEREKLTESFGSLGRRAAENVRIKNQYQEVLRNLVKRYVAAMIRDAKTEEGLTEENFKELKQDISSFRYEVLGMMKGNRSCVPALSPRDAACGGFTSPVPDHLMPYVLPSALAPTSPRAKLNLYEVTTILQHHHHHHQPQPQQQQQHLQLQAISDTSTSTTITITAPPMVNTATVGMDAVGSLGNGMVNIPRDEASVATVGEPSGPVPCSTPTSSPSSTSSSSSSGATSCQESASRKDFPRDTGSVGLLQKRGSQGGKSVSSSSSGGGGGRGERQSGIYSVSEEADERAGDEEGRGGGGEGREEEEEERGAEEREEEEEESDGDDGEGVERRRLSSYVEGERKKRGSREEQRQEVEEDEEEEDEEEEDELERGTPEKEKTEPLLRRDGEGSVHSPAR